MARFVKKQEIIEAVQFVDASAKSDDIGIEIRPYHLDDGDRLCSKCGLALSLHGVVDRDAGWGTICPGTWILDDGRELTDAEMQARYEAEKV